MARTNNSISVPQGVKGDECILFRKINALFGEQSDQFFQQVLDQRLSLVCQCDPTLSDKNIASKLLSPFYFAGLKHPLSIGSNEWHQLEQEALYLYDNWAQAWCAYKIWTLEQQYTQPCAPSNDLATAGLSNAEADYFDNVIDNVEHHQELYYTLHCTQPMRLADAIVMINLATFVSQYQWYEMLYEIDLSSTGSHFILASQNVGSTHPLIVATAKVNHYTQADNWLYFSPFFQTESWQLLATDKVVKNLNQQGLLSTADIATRSAKQFEHSLWQQMQSPEQCCEIIRLTVSGNQTQMIFFLYLAQKRLMEQLVSRQYKIAFVVIEQPLMIQYYLSLGDSVYNQLSASYVSNSKFATYKGLWLVEPLHQALAQCSFKQYKQRTISQLKLYRKHGQKPQYA